jgi:hypothetical protein
MGLRSFLEMRYHSYIFLTAGDHPLHLSGLLALACPAIRIFAKEGPHLERKIM